MTEVQWIIGQTQKWRDHVLLPSLKNNIGLGHRVPHFYILVPSLRRSNFLYHQFQKEFKSSPLWKPKILLISELVKNLFESEIRNHFSPQVLLESERLVCVEESLRRIKDQVEYFGPLFGQGIDLFFQQYPGMLEKLSGFISFLKDNDLEESFVERLQLDEFGNAGTKDHDLAVLFGEYSNLLRENNLFDYQDQMSAVVNHLKNSKKINLFSDTTLLVIDSIGFLSRLEEKFLLNVIPHFKNIIISFEYHSKPEELLKIMKDDNNQYQDLPYRFYHPLKSFLSAMVSNSNFSHHYNLVTSKEEKIPDFLSVFSNFGQMKTESKVNSLKSITPQLRIYPIGKRVDEIRFIAREIKKLIHQGVSFDQIHVMFPKIEKYTSIIYEIFPEYGIPFSITRGLPLTSSPLAIVIRSILKIPQGFHREDLFRFFSSNLIRFRLPFDKTDFELFLNRFEIGARSSIMNHDELMDRYHRFLEEQEKLGFHSSHFDIATLDRYARRANVRGGEDVLKDWFIPLDRSYFSSQFHSSFEKAEEQERIKRVYFLIIRQLYFLEKIKKEFLTLKKAKTPEKVLNEIARIISLFKISENVVRRLQEMPDLKPKDRLFLLRRDVRALYKVFQILEDLKKLFFLRKKIQKDSNPENALSIVFRLLSEEFQNRVILDPMDPDLVQVTETLEVRGLNFDYCFFGGLTIEEFPRILPPDFILPDTPNSCFRILNAIDESKFLLCHVLRNTGKEIHLTYPQMDGHEELEKSPFVEDLEFWNPNLVKKISNKSNEIYSPRELEIYLSGLVPLKRGSWPLEFGYLVQKSLQNERIEKGIQVELYRLNNQKFGPYDGVFENCSNLPLESIFSYSQLEQFAICPQHYFYSRYLGLEPLDEVTEEARPDEFGTYVHDILEKFYKVWLSKGFEKIDSNNFSKANQLMQKCAHEVLKTQEKHNEYILWDNQKEKIIAGLEENNHSDFPPGILRSFLDFELSQEEDEWKPFWIEKKFGFKDENFKINEVRLCGKMDRVDINNVKSEKSFRIFDYKTGNTPDPKKFLLGLHFQIPIYIWALKEIFPKSSVIGAYYCLKDPTNIEIKNLFSRNKFSQPYSDLLKQWMQSIVNQNQKGVFHYAFDDSRCKYCDYRYICRRDSNRLKHLEGLEQRNYYVPKRNLELYYVLTHYLKIEKEIKSVIKRKKEQKRPRLGSKESSLGKTFRKTFLELPENFQNKYQNSFDQVIHNWNELVEGL